MIERPPLALYAHVPWCVRKCPYCDFNSHAIDGALPEREWLERLRADLDQEVSDDADRPLTSIFFGGGTPSLLAPATIAGALDAVRERFELAPDAEITLEANPGTVEAERFSGYLDAGVNRLSIGIQSFDDTALERLGRVHGGEEAQRALDTAFGAGFIRVNADLMHGLPGQTVRAALADIERALAAGVDHLSWYQLTIEPNTAFHNRPPLLPEEDTLADIEDAGFERLTKAGFERYEVSAWAQTDAASRHNLNYWRFGDYLGVGPGAHGKLTRGDGRVERTRRTRVPRDWFASEAPERNAALVDTAALAGEFMMNVLRLTDGVPEALFEARTGLPLATIADALAAARADDLLHADRIAATPLGLRFLDRLVANFVD